MSAGGRGVTPQFNPAKFRGAPPEVLALVREIEAALAAPVEGESVGGGKKSEYVSSVENLDSFLVRKGKTTAKVLGFEAAKDHMLVNFTDADGKANKVQLGPELLEIVQKRNRALTQLEVFIQSQLEQGKVGGEQKSKLQDILSNVSEYQSSLMHGIDKALKLSEKLADMKG